ncbi:MAG: hypothetical protein HPY75_14660 [Actinobacteria bacterium]|nr:hypothetical protein [Actinomycetota bacterium]
MNRAEGLRGPIRLEGGVMVKIHPAIAVAAACVFLLIAGAVPAIMSADAPAAAPEAASNWIRIARGGMDGTYDVSPAAVLCEYGARLYAGLTWGRVMAWDGAAWTQVNAEGFGNPDNLDISSLAVFGRSLYAGTTNVKTGAEVWRYDGASWSRVANGGFGNPGNANVNSMAAYGAYLYAGTSNVDEGCEVWRYDGSAWEPVAQGGFGDASNDVATSMGLFGGALYVGTLKEDESGCEAWRYDGSDWQQSGEDGFGDGQNKSLNAFAEYGGLLYAGIARESMAPGSQGGFSLYRFDGTQWNLFRMDEINYGGANCLAAFGGYLYVDTYNSTQGCGLWRSDGADEWELAAPYGYGYFSNIDASSLAAWNGDLYAATINPLYGTQIWRSSCAGSVPYADWAQVNIDGFSVNHNSSVSSLSVYGGRLVAGTGNPLGCEAWRLEGASWERIASGGLAPDPSNFEIASAEVFGSALYMGTGRDIPSASLWRYDGSALSLVSEDGLGDPYNTGISCLVECGDALYAGTVGNYAGSVYRYDGGSGFARVAEPGFGGENDVHALACAQGRLYAGTGGYPDGAAVWAYDGSGAGSSAWTKVSPQGFGDENQAVSSMAVYNGSLFVATLNRGGCEVWAYDGLRWDRVAEGGFGDEVNVSVSSMTVFGGRLYAGTQRSPGMPGGCQVWSYDGASWRQEVGDGFGSDANRTVSAMASSGRRLYAGTENGTEGCEVWRLDEGVEYPYAWYFAEGSTGSDWRGIFETWITVANPGEGTASVALTYLTPEGEVEGPSMELGAGKRWTVNVADTVPGEWSVATVVGSTAPVVAERSTYWHTGEGWFGGVRGVYRQSAHASLGAASPANRWYFAEGSTGSDWRGIFETWITVANPGEGTATVALTYLTPKGEVEGPSMELGAGKRWTVNVGDTVPEEWSVATVVESTAPVVAERSTYWSAVGDGEDDTYAYRRSAHASIGTPGTADRWYFAEGSTGSDWRGGFETWITVANSGEGTATVALTYLTPKGEVEGPSMELGAGKRWTVNVGDTVPGEWSVATVVESSAPVVAERSTYWSAAGGGDAAAGGGDAAAGGWDAVYRQSAHASIGTRL